HKYCGEVIGGIWQQVTDHSRYRSFATGVAMTAALHELYPAHLRFLRGVYEFNDSTPAFDLLAGNSHIRRAIESGGDGTTILSSWHQDEEDFSGIKPQFHLYKS
ncbi:MAG: DUF1343 domain-containing protein, partial [Chlorobium sp.]